MNLDLRPEWLRSYGGRDLRRDVLAGLTVGVMLVPQGMAYALIAGVPPIYGLYAALAPLLVYPLLGTSRHLTIGPVAIDMLIVAVGLGTLADPGSPRFVALAILLAGMVGILQLGMAAARLGNLANLLSRPVIVGFAAAAAIIIVFSQVGNLLGIELPSSEAFPEMVWRAFQAAPNVHWLTLGIGGGGIVFLAACQRWKPLFPWELLFVIGATVATWWFGLEAKGVQVIGEIPTGLPLPGVPSLSLADLRSVLSTAVTLALVQFMTVSSLGRVFAARHGYSIDPNRELAAVGSANLVGCFFQSIPASGSFSRTAVNEKAGGRSPLVNVVTAGLIGLVLLFFTPLFHHLPMAALASLIMVAAFGLIDAEEIRYIFQTKRKDGYIAILTFGTTLLVGIQEGILLGIGASMLGLIYRSSRPNVAKLGHMPGTRSFRDMDRNVEATPLEGLLILRVDASFSFANAEFFKEFIIEESEETLEETEESPRQSAIRILIIDGSSINDLDTTAVEALQTVVQKLDELDIDLHFAGLVGPVREVMERSGLRELIGPDHFHISVHHAVEAILEQWDSRDEGDRWQRYIEATVDVDKGRDRT